MANNNNSTAEEILTRILQVYAIKKAWGWKSKLAEKLETTQSTVSSWDKRGVPEAIIAKVSRDTGYSFRWLETGESENESAYSVRFSRAPKHSLSNDNQDQEFWGGYDKHGVPLDKTNEKQDDYGSALNPVVVQTVMGLLDQIEEILGEKLSTEKRSIVFTKLYNRKAAGEAVRLIDIAEDLKAGEG